MITIRFYVKEQTEPIIYICEGDCCSETWFADIIGVQSLLQQEVIDVAEMSTEKSLSNYNINDGRGRQEYDEVYGYRLMTRLGTCDFVFRNSSNGYYGGHLALYVAKDRSNWQTLFLPKATIGWDIVKDYTENKPEVVSF